MPRRDDAVTGRKTGNPPDKKAQITGETGGNRRRAGRRGGDRLTFHFGSQPICGIAGGDAADECARPGAGARFHHDDRRAALHPADGRSRRRGDQDRGARGRHDAGAAADAERRQHLVRAAQHRQEKRRPRFEAARGGGGGAAPGQIRRCRGREFPPRGDGPLRPRLRKPAAAQPGAHLLRDLGLRPERAVGRAAGLCAGDPCQLGLRPGPDRASDGAAAARISAASLSPTC